MRKCINQVTPTHKKNIQNNKAKTEKPSNCETVLRAQMRLSSTNYLDRIIVQFFPQKANRRVQPCSVVGEPATYDISILYDILCVSAALLQLQLTANGLRKAAEDAEHVNDTLDFYLAQPWPLQSFGKSTSEQKMCLSLSI